MSQNLPRTLCLHCQRPEKSCICRFTVGIANDIHVVVLQHPSEVSQTKGTVALLAKSLGSCQVIVGEDFSGDIRLDKIYKVYHTVLLYPAAQAQILNQQLALQLQTQLQDSNYREVQAKPLCLVILDGTWKKAYRMFMLSKSLQQLLQICLPDYLANAGQYHLRKVAKKNALSSLEAICYALALFEAGEDFGSINAEKTGKYQPLLNKFHEFNQFQLSFRPENTNTSRKPDDS
jgi:DTW domain-containing protein YfiP